MNLRGRTILIAGILLFCFMLASLLMMSDALQNSQRFDEYYSSLLIFNAGGLLVLVVLIGINLKNLIAQYRRRAPGIRMTLRMVTMFCLLAVTPVLIVYYFSLDFLHRGIDNWFDMRVEKALDDSLQLSRLALETRMKEILKQAKNIAEGMADISNPAVPFEIDDFRQRSGAQELDVMTRQGNIIASSASDTSSLVPHRPDETILFQVQQGNSYIGLDSEGQDGLSIRAVVNVPQMGVETEPRIIQVLYPFSQKINALAGNVQTAYVKYKELSFLRRQLKFSFVLVLTLVLLFTIFSAVWAAFYSAIRLASPIRDLAEGTQAVAAGNYGTKLRVPSNDELGFLVASFNEMTRRIAQARDAVRQSQQEAEAQRAYLEAVLTRLSSGVLVLDQNQRLRTANISSGRILGIDVGLALGKTVSEIQLTYPYLEQLLQSIKTHMRQRSDDWREQITLFGTGGRQILMCTGTTLALPQDTATHMHVVLFDDITALIQGQKNAAWSEMARRLAHEIKNPLTPIRLAAERLRHKYLHNPSAEQSDTLDKLTNTIIQQVETMQHMVNTFSDYARVPAMSPQLVDLNQLLLEVLDLYSNLDSNAEIQLHLADSLPRIKVDRGRIRQVFNNILNNAFDANISKGKAVLSISTEHIADKGVDFIEIRIRDSGPGVSEDIIPTIFEPYVTTKQKGTGLGLAIVKKIVDEHNGLVWLENNRDGPGVCAVIRLPVTDTEGMHDLGMTGNKRDVV